MSKSLSLGLLIAGIVVIVVGVIAHFELSVAIFPHFSIVLGVIGLIVAAAGAWGFMSGRQSA